MKISEIFSALFPKVRKVQGPKNSNFPKVESNLLKRPDEIKFAGDAKLYASLRADLAKMDGTREEKVAEIRRRLDDGAYNVVTEELARKILGE
jgi:anti-sigma28 factor (negative regulator of flagellin synthesis)